MSRGGRVMGRGRSLQAPVDATEQITDPITELASMLQAMRANADMQEKLAIRDVASRAAEHPDTVVKVAYMLHQTCINDWHKVDNIGELCCYLAAQEPNGQSFRNALLVMLQNEHQQLKQRALSEARSLSFAALLCYVVVNMRNKDGSHLSPLVDPLAETIGVILNDQASDEAVACATDQIHKARELLPKFSDVTYLGRLQNAIRQVLSNERGSRDARLQLLNDLEVLVPAVKS